MASKELDELVKMAEELTSDEQLALIAHLVNRMRSTYQAPEPCRRWHEICGSASYPLVGEDAQFWVSRTRRESDEQREKHLRINC